MSSRTFTSCASKLVGYSFPLGDASLKKISEIEKYAGQDPTHDYPDSLIKMSNDLKNGKIPEPKVLFECWCFP